MTMPDPRRAALAALLAFACMASPAFAQEDTPPPPEEIAGADGFDISATATVVSDYRFRGISDTDRDPSVQGTLDVSYNGFYVGAFVGSIARTADTNVELDLYAGYAGSAGGIDYEVGAIAYLYPGGDGSENVYEATAAASYTLGPATAKLSVNYAPDQENLDGDNLYISGELRAGIPATPVTVFAQVGRERGSFAGRKWDWSVGVDLTRGPFTASLYYVDTNLDSDTSEFGRNVRAGVVAALSFSF